MHLTKSPDFSVCQHSNTINVGLDLLPSASLLSSIPQMTLSEVQAVTEMGVLGKGLHDFSISMVVPHIGVQNDVFL